MSSSYGKYRILRRLAAGGMAEVFHAQVTGPGGFVKDVCLKRVLPHLAADVEFLEMFKAEARLAARLQHANIVQIFDFGEQAGTYFLAMEYVDGCDLRRLLDAARRRGDRLDAPLAAFIAHEAAEGLAYAHALHEGSRPLGIVHRDISPHNLLVSRHGEVKIADFGIAKAASRATATRTGVLKGKLGYMSPEQARGEPVDARSDIFSLGIVLHEMLTGERLFQAHTESETLGRVLNGPIPAPNAVRPDLPESLSSLTLRALARDPGERFQTAGDFARALAHFLRAVDPDQGTAPALAAFVARVGRSGHADEVSGNTESLEDAASSPTRTAERPYPVSGPADPTRLAEDTLLGAATAVTRTGVVRTARGRAAWLALAAVAAASAGAGALWWLHDEALTAPPAAGAPSGGAPATVAPPPAPAPTPARAAPIAPAAVPPTEPEGDDEGSEAAPEPRRTGERAPQKTRAPAPARAAPMALAAVPPSEPEGDEERDEPAPEPKRTRARAPRKARAPAPAPSPPPVETAPPSPGWLHIAVVPWAEIFVDGRKVSDVGPKTLRVAAGKHRVRLRNRERGYDRTFEVDVPPGGRTRLQKDLDRP